MVWHHVWLVIINVAHLDVLLYLIGPTRGLLEHGRGVSPEDCDLHRSIVVVLGPVGETRSDPSGISWAELAVPIGEVSFVVHVAVQDKVHGPRRVVVERDRASMDRVWVSTV